MILPCVFSCEVGEQSYWNCIYIRPSLVIAVLWFCKTYVSTVYLLAYIKISAIGQIDILYAAFVYISCDGTFPVLFS